jgi:hypothetical protein
MIRQFVAAGGAFTGTSFLTDVHERRACSRERIVLWICPASPSRAETKGKECHCLPRFAFSGSVLLFEPVVDTSVNTQVHNLSLDRCKVEFRHAYPVGTRFEIKISAEAGAIDAWAIVVHEELRGIKLVFHSVPPQRLEISERWFSAVPKKCGDKGMQ